MLLRQLKEFLGFQDNTDIRLFIFSNESGSINFYVSFKRTHTVENGHSKCGPSKTLQKPAIPLGQMSHCWEESSCPRETRDGRKD